MEWFDNSSISMTATYNISGLLINTYYDVYDTSSYVDTYYSGSTGAISFTIDLTPANSNHDIVVTVAGCLEEGSLVLTPDGFRNIEDLKVGDYVIGYKDGKNVTAKITKTAVHDGTWTLYNYKGYWFTGNHKVYTDYEHFEQVYKLSHVTKDYNGNVYDITVADTGNFFGANGLLIHNK